MNLTKMVSFLNGFPFKDLESFDDVYDNNVYEAQGVNALSQM